MQRSIGDRVKLIFAIDPIEKSYGARAVFGVEIPRDLPFAVVLEALRAPTTLERRAKAKPMNSVQVAETLLRLEGSSSLAERFGSGRKCDTVPVQFVMLTMFPDTAYEDLEAGLKLAVTLARLDEAEAQALGDWRPGST
jgi:hypothetical protein